MEQVKQAFYLVVSLVGCLGLLVAGTIALIRLLPAERRQTLSQLPGSGMGWMVDHMPDE
jgi:hypothetical protein